MSSFSIGEIVQLKSGGPLMVIVNIDKEITSAPIQCKWFDNKTETYIVDSFKPDSLVLSKKPENEYDRLSRVLSSPETRALFFENLKQKAKKGEL